MAAPAFGWCCLDSYPPSLPFGVIDLIAHGGESVTEDTE